MTNSQQSDDKPTPANLPGAPSPSLVRPAAPAPSGESLAKAKEFGRVADDGHVYVLLRGEDLPVGAYPDATADEALTYFAKKFVELEAQVALLETRVRQKAASGEAAGTARKLRAQLTERGVVGDIAALEERLDALETLIQERVEEDRQESARAKEKHLAERESLVQAAEEVAAQDPGQTHWKNSSSRMNDLFATWKTAQRNERISKSDEDRLWKRFRAARTTFDKNRRSYFSQLDQENAKAKKVKEGLIAEAEALQNSTDWSETAAKYRDLMDRWKKAPRAARREDDALWARFRAAQDVFFGARSEANAEVEKEFRENLTVKEGLLEKARAILPVRDVDTAKARLAPILDAWDEAGMVPRDDVRRIEGELQKVQNAISDAEQRQWEESNPETQARASSMVSQLQATIADLEKELADAEAKGDQKKAAKTREALETRQAWLDQLSSSETEA